MFVENAKEIRIKRNPGTIVLLTGISGSGKTYISQKWFDEANVISTDGIFYDTFKKSKFNDMNSIFRYWAVSDSAQAKITNLIKESKTNPYTVLDSLGDAPDKWCDQLSLIQTLYTNTILIVVQPEFNIAIKQLHDREKDLILENQKIGLTIRDQKELLSSFKQLEWCIKNKVVNYNIKTGIAINETYIVREPEKVQIILE